MQQESAAAGQRQRPHVAETLPAVSSRTHSRALHARCNRQTRCSCLSEYHASTADLLRAVAGSQAVAGTEGVTSKLRESGGQLVKCGKTCDRFGCPGFCEELVRKGRPHAHVHRCSRRVCGGVCGRSPGCPHPCQKSHTHTVEEYMALQPGRAARGPAGVGDALFGVALTDEDVTALTLPAPSESVVTKAFGLERVMGQRLDSFGAIVGAAQRRAGGRGRGGHARAGGMLHTKRRRDELALDMRAGNCGVSESLVLA